MNTPGRGWWQRLRHGRGFGVHSPFAYRFIREVLRERCAFYAYEAVDAEAHAWPGGSRGARLLLRVTAWAHPASVAVAGTGSEACAARRIVALACPAASIRGLTDHIGACDMVVLCRDAAPGEAAAAARACAAGALLFVPSRHDAVAAGLLATLRGLPYGHTFLNGSGTAIYVGRRTLPSEVFNVRF